MSSSVSEIGSRVSSIFNFVISVQRLYEFFKEPELDRYIESYEPVTGFSKIGIQNGNFTYGSASSSEEYEETPQTFFLRNVTVNFPVGKFTAIIGPTGSGKSSLFAAMLGEMKRISGKYYIPENHLFGDNPTWKSDVCYVPQTAWLMNATIKDNILFGEEYDEERYTRVLAACALQLDLENLQDGDLTEIGEKGINLSGGQKQRVSLGIYEIIEARAAYSKASIVLLDDPLSAVDSPTGKHLLNHCILKLFKGRTVLLISHAINLVIPQVDFVVIMQNGQIVDHKEPSELLDSSLKNLMFGTSAENIENLNLSGIKDFAEKSSTVRNTEISGTGRIKWEVYTVYLSALGGPVFIIILMFFHVSETFMQYGYSWWIDYWTKSVNSTNVFEESSPLFYVSVFGLIGLAENVIWQVGFVFKRLAIVWSGRKLHRKLLDSVLGAPLSFFEKTPVGRIINRFSQDILAVDTHLIFAIDYVNRLIIKCLVKTLIVSVYNPMFLISFVFGYFYVRIGEFYLAPARELKRICRVADSPILGLFGETLMGTSTIRAYGAEKHMIGQFEGKVEASNRATFFLQCLNRWLDIRVQLISQLIVFCAGMAIIIGRMQAGTAGIVITLTMEISSTLSRIIGSYTTMEISMNAIERINEYIKLEQEPPKRLENRPPYGWPQSGKISIRNLSIRYAPDLPDVLKNISLDIKPHEKLGVVGRTGAGKTSLSMAFFRIMPFSSGSIVIDDVDICKIGLYDLRSNLTMIPQGKR